MSGKFGVGTLIHSAEFYEKINDFNDDIPFYKELCSQSGGSVLELCCGTGRITVELLKSGFDVTGLDITESMLSAAKKKVEKENLKADLILGDMTDFSLDKKFDLIFIPFNSLQCLYKVEDVEKVFTCVKKHLKPGGTFAIDVFNPNLQYLTRDEEMVEKLFDFKLDTGEHVTVTQTMKYDIANQINRVKWLHNIDGVESVQKLDMRCFFPLEMDALLKYNGFEIRSKYGSFSKGTFEGSSPKQIYVCRVK